jgi:hypothetical protein
MESAADSLDLVTAPVLCKALKDAGVSGLSGAEKAELMRPRVPLSLPTLKMQFPCRTTSSPPQGRHSLMPTPR